jgi:hypothetical protein
MTFALTRTPSPSSASLCSWPWPAWPPLGRVARCWLLPALLISTLLGGEAEASSRKGVGGPGSAESTYQRAKAELPQQLYPYYRLLDRIIGANATIQQKATLGIRSLDEASCKQMLGDAGVCSVASELPDVKKEDHFLIWALQVAGSTAGAPNAFAQSNNNRIVINRALDLAFSDDLEAKACVVAHEMAHIQQDHSKQLKAGLAEWNTEAARKITAAVRNAHSAKSSNEFWTTLSMVANAASAGYSASVGNYNAAAAAGNSNEVLAARQQADRSAGQNLVASVLKVAQSEAPEVFTALKGMDGLPASLVSRTLKDVNVYLEEVSDKGFGLSREQELEADRLAVTYLAKAGINPEGCLRVVANLHRGHYRPLASKTDTHPGEQERMQNMKAAITANAADYARSKVKAIKPAPLTYRYDSRLEVVTLYPATRSTGKPLQAPAIDVDSLLGK